MQASYKIVSQGCREGADPHQVAQRVAALFRCQPSDVEALLRTRRSTVKRKLDLKRADRYRRALDDCGLVVSIEEEAPGQAPPRRAQPSRRLDAAPPRGDRLPAAVSTPIEEAAPAQLPVQPMPRDDQAAAASPVEFKVSVEDLIFQMRCDAEDERERNRRVHRRFLIGISVFCLLMLLWMGGLFG